MWRGKMETAMRGRPAAGWLIVGLFFIGAGFAWGQGKPHIAVLDLETHGAEAAEVESISEVLREAFVASGRFVVVDRTLTRKILEEWALQQSGAVDEEKAIKVGKLFNVQYIVTGRLSKFDEDGWQVAAVLLDAQSGVTRQAKVIRHQGNFFSLLDNKVPQLAATLAGVDVRKAPPPLVVKRPDRATRKKAEALHEKGADLWDGEQYDPLEKAIAFFSEAIQLDPGLVDAYYDRGNVYLELEEFTRAVADFSQAIRLNPQYADAYYDRGNAHAEMEEYRKAIADYNEAIRLNPEYADAFFDRGDAWLELKNTRRAIADFDKAIRLEPENADAHYARGNAYDEQGRTQLAIADYEKAIRLDPKHEDAYYDLGLTLFEEGDRERACKNWHMACELGSETACRRVKSKC